MGWEEYSTVTIQFITSTDKPKFLQRQELVKGELDVMYQESGRIFRLCQKPWRTIVSCSLCCTEVPLALTTIDQTNYFSNTGARKEANTYLQVFPYGADNSVRFPRLSDFFSYLLSIHILVANNLL